MKSIRANPSSHAVQGDERIRTAVPALRTERDELVIQNERLGNDIVAAEARCARLQQALRGTYEAARSYLRYPTLAGRLDRLTEALNEAEETLAGLDADVAQNTGSGDNHERGAAQHRDSDPGRGSREPPSASSLAGLDTPADSQPEETTT